MAASSNQLLSSQTLQIHLSIPPKFSHPITSSSLSLFPKPSICLFLWTLQTYASLIWVAFSFISFTHFIRWVTCLGPGTSGQPCALQSLIWWPPSCQVHCLPFSRHTQVTEVTWQAKNRCSRFVISCLVWLGRFSVLSPLKQWDLLVSIITIHVTNASRSLQCGG